MNGFDREIALIAKGIQMPNFPFEAWPMFIRDVVSEVAVTTQVPYELVATTALVVMAEAAQGAYDVEIPGWGTSPLSLSAAVIADSGVGKSVAMKVLREAIVSFEAQSAERHRTEAKRYSLDLDLWTAEYNALNHAFKRNVGKGESTDKLKGSLDQLLDRKPSKPRKVQLSYGDVTPSALKQGLSENWPNCCVVTDEGSGFFKGRMKNEWGVWNQIWDGSQIVVNRKDEEVFVTRPRMSMLLMVQSESFRRYLEAAGEAYRDEGALARFLVCAPFSNQGWRFRHGESPSYTFVPVFQRRISQALRKSFLETGEPVGNPEVLKFSEAAKECFFSIHNDIEREQQFGGSLFQARDHASKITRNVARIAALLHLFETEEPDGEISLESLMRAVDIARFYTGEFLRLFCALPPVPRQYQDADTLFAWMIDFSQKHHVRYVLKCDLQKGCPYPIRKKEISDAAINVLIQQGRISGWLLGKINYYDMYPSYPFDPAALEFAIAESRSRRKVAVKLS